MLADGWLPVFHPSIISYLHISLMVNIFNEKYTKIPSEYSLGKHDRIMALCCNARREVMIVISTLFG